MKKQTRTYLLLALVIAIWGMIGYQIFGSTSSDNIGPRDLGNFEFKPKKIKQKDTFSILANYRDPFLGTVAKQKTGKRKKTGTRKPVLPQIRVIYTGSITDTNTGQHIFFVTIDGQQYVMRNKDKKNGVTLVNGSAAQIRIKSNGKLRVIPIQK